MPLALNPGVNGYLSLPLFTPSLKKMEKPITFGWITRKIDIYIFKNITFHVIALNKNTLEHMEIQLLLRFLFYANNPNVGSAVIRDVLKSD